MAGNRVYHNKPTKRMIDWFSSLICLMLLLDMTEMGTHAQGVNILKQETVLLRNKHINGYLVRAGSYDHDRNHVSVAKDIVTNKELTIGGGLSHQGVGLSVSSSIPLGYSSTDARWNLVDRGDGKFEIIHSAFNEPLYAASDRYAYDNDRRRVLTWKKGPSVAQGYWRFEDAGNGFYRIKNTAHNEYLYASDFPSQGWIFTWRGNNINNAKFLWQLVHP